MPQFTLLPLGRSARLSLNAKARLTAAARISLCIAVLSLLTSGIARAQQFAEIASAPPVAAFVARPDATPALAQPLHLIFSLKSADIKQIEAFVASQQDPTSPNYHRWMSAEQFGQRFGAPQSDVDAVVNYAKSQGFVVRNVWPNHLFVSVNTDVAHAQAAFGVTIGGYQRPSNMIAEGDPATFFAPRSNPKLPVSIADKVHGIYGLDNLLLAHSELSSAAGRAALIRPDAFGSTAGARIGPVDGTIKPNFTGPLGPGDLSKVYDITGLQSLGANGTGLKIAIYSPTERYTGDPQDFANEYGLGTVNVTDVDIDGGPTTNGGADEASLDVEVIEGQCPKANIVFYDCPGPIADRFDALSQIEKDKDVVVSSSWGTEEINILADGTAGQTYVTDLQTASAQCIAAGIPIYNAAGDSGAFDRETGTKLTALTEATEPDTTAVGGTALPTDNNGLWSSETAWEYDSTTNSGGGGGLSIFYAEPTYQAGPGVSNSYSNGMRQVPDIAALADPNTPGYVVVIDGALAGIGGTSAATPLWASVNALMDELTGSLSGSLNTQLYYIGTNLNTTGYPFVYHDITVGSDGNYPATTDWDFCTGWGSADFTKLYKDLYLAPNFLPYNPGSTGPDGAWTSPIMIHVVRTNVVEPSSFNSTTPYYFAACIADQSGTADGLPCTCSMQIDGVDNLFTTPAFSSGYYWAFLGPVQQTLTPGSHTIKLIVNTTGLKETNTADDTYTRTITVVSNAPTLTSVTVSPTSVTAGTNATGTVTLSAAAPTGGSVVNVSSNKPTDAVPAVSSVTVPAGSTTANFTIYTAKSVPSPITATISAVYAGVTQTASVTVNPVPAVTLTSVTASPNPVTAGTNATGTVTLSAPAPTGGIAVALSSNKTTDADPAVSSVTVPAGSTTATFKIYTAKSLTAPVTATISAVYNGVTQTVSLTVNPAVIISLTSVTASPNPVTSGTNATGTVTLSAAAPTGGIVVTLSSNLPKDAVPAVTSVTVPSGATTANFTIYTAKNLTTSVTAIISAVYNGVTQIVSLTVNPAVVISLTSVTASPNPVTSGTNATGTVTLNAAAPTGGIVVTLSSNLPKDAVPAVTSVTVPSGATTASFTIYTAKNLTTTITATISAVYNGVTRTVSLTVNPTGPALGGFAIAPTEVTSGAVVAGSVALTEVAPAGGILVTVTSNMPTIASPESENVVIPAGSSLAEFNIFTSNNGPSPVVVTLSASYNGVTLTTTLTVDPVSSGVNLQLVSITPNDVSPGFNSVGTVVLSGNAPTGGTVVALSSNKPSDAVPAVTSVTVPAGSTNANFTIYTAKSLATAVTATISAVYNGVTQTANITVDPANPTLNGFTISPTTVTSGATATGTVTLSAPELSPPLAVSLSSSNSAVASVPSSVTVATGSTSAAFTITTSNTTGSPVTVTIYATRGGYQQIATITVNP